jgi:transposase
LCNAHLLRELLYVKETAGQSWAQAMSDFLLNANALCEAARAQEMAFDADNVRAFRTVYDSIVREGELLNPATDTRAKQSTAANFLRRFREHADAVLRFIGNFAVPFTNNLAERAVRMPKVKQKISGCFRSLDGADIFASSAPALTPYESKPQHAHCPSNARLSAIPSGLQRSG